MTKKIKYSAIFALCSMLSCGVGAAASSSSSTEGQAGTSYSEERVFRCYSQTIVPTQANKNLEPLIENPEKIIINSLNKINYTYDKKTNMHKIRTGDDIFELLINRTSACSYGRKGIIVDFHVDPDDSTKANFVKLRSFVNISERRPNINLLIIENMRLW